MKNLKFLFSHIFKAFFYLLFSVQFIFHPSTSFGAGGLVTTCKDINLFLNALDRKILFKSDSKFLRMIDLGNNDWYGYGVFVKNHDICGKYFGQGGVVFGTNSIAFNFMEDKIRVSGFITLDGTKESI